MNDEQYLLANAYVDGELTDDERRTAEADPDVMSEVDEIHALRAELADLEPPSASARESAISAAMSEFEQGAAAGRPSTPVVPHRPRPAMARYLGIAAAVVAVGLLGVVVATSGLGGGDDDDSGADFATDAASTVEAAPDFAEEDVARTEAADAESEFGDGGAGEATAEATMEEAEEAPAAEATAEEAAGDDELLTDADDAAAEEAETDASEAAPVEGGIDVIRPDFDPDDFIVNEAELGVYGSMLLERESLGELAPTPNTSCPEEFNILAATRLVEGEISSPIYVAVQDEDPSVIGLDQGNCDPLIASPLLPIP